MVHTIDHTTYDVYDAKIAETFHPNLIKSTPLERALRGLRHAFSITLGIGQRGH